MDPIDYRTEPSRYRHWRIEIDGRVASLVMDVDPAGGLLGGYELKLNSYDLGVDIELYDAVQRLRFEHPEVGAVVIRSGKDNVFCAGANIRMLGGASHGHKVNFCKFTNETRLSIEDATQNSGQFYLAAVNGTAAGGGYELAVSADHIMLVDDRKASVSLPEMPLLAVLPGTGGLTRITDKRRVRRDLADVFCSTEEGLRGKRAVEWRLVDEVVPPSGWAAAVRARAEAFAARTDRPADSPGVALTRLERVVNGTTIAYPHLRVELGRGAGRATLVVHGPDAPPPETAEAAQALGVAFWPLAVARALDDAILHLRTNEPDLGLWVFRTEGDAASVLAHDAFLDAHAGHWLMREVRHYLKRTLKRLDVTSRSLIALIEPGSCFAGTLAELAFAADRSIILTGQREGDNRPAPALHLSEANFGAYPMGNGLTRLQTRFLGEPQTLAAVHTQLGEALASEDAEALGLVTFAYDQFDWDDEVRIMLEERASFSPDSLTGLEANLRFPGPETMETRIFGRLTAWQNWIFQRPNAVGEHGALQRYGSGLQPTFDRNRVWQEHPMPDGTTALKVDYDGLIPNNVNLNADMRVRKALETWHPGYIDWWRDMGPEGFQESLVYLRTAIGVDPKGWAKFDYVRMPEYKWGVLLAPAVEGRTIPFGKHKGEPVWQEIPGEYRAMLRRLITIQGDTEPASVEQQRHLGKTAPSLYDMRNLFQVNVEEGRHLWAMVYLLQKYFGKEGREEADDLLRRRSGNQDSPRMLGAFNEATPDWLSFFMFTYFTDRDGKMQLEALAQSGFDPLSRTCRFMLTEEAHHMFVGDSGVSRVVERTCQAMKQAGITDPADIAAVRALGVIDLPTIQKKMNLHFSLTLDLFGNEISTNAANAFTSGIKGRYREEKLDDDHALVDAIYPVQRLRDGTVVAENVPALSALNMRLRDDYVGDCASGVTRWNRVIEKAGFGFRLALPHVAFNRGIGEFKAVHAGVDGRILGDAEWAAARGGHLPDDADAAFIASLMVAESRPGHYAGWIAPPRVGIDNKPGEFEYVQIHE